MKEELTDGQRMILKVLVESCQEHQTDGVFRFVSEYLGYLPFGLYMWVEVGNDNNVDKSLPSRWEREDIEAIARLGFAELIQKYVQSEDGMDYTIHYRLTLSAYKAALS